MSAPDPFTALPVELLDEIAELVYADYPKQYLGAVCKAFLPSSRRRFFKETVVHGGKRFKRFHDVVKGSAGVAQALRVVHLYQQDGTGYKPGTEMGPDAVCDLGRRLINVDEFKYDGRYEVAKLLIEPPDSSFFPSLRHLSLAFPLENRSDSLDARRFSHLAQYPRLDAFELEVESIAAQRWIETPNPRRDERLPSNRSWWLSLSGELPSRKFFRDLISMFPRIDTLVLDGERKDLGRLLSAVQQPLHLTALILDTAKSVLYISTTFNNLVSLELLSDVHSGPDFASLSSLPYLSRLVLRRGSRVPLDMLKSLLDLPSLQTLRLDRVYKPSPYFSSPSPLDYPGWSEGYTDTNPPFTPRGVGELFDIADEKGIKLIGLAVGLVKRERAYEARWEKKKK